VAAGTPVVVLSHDPWQRRFSGDPSVAGRTVSIDGAPHEVVGVMPSGGCAVLLAAGIALGSLAAVSVEPALASLLHGSARPTRHRWPSHRSC
jgi:hypothetical protein